MPTSPSIPVTGTPKAKQPARQSHSPTHQQACTLMTPEPAAPWSQTLSTREPMTWPAQQCTGSSLRTPHPVGKHSPRIPWIQALSPVSQTPTKGYLKVLQPETPIPGFMQE